MRFQLTHNSIFKVRDSRLKGIATLRYLAHTRLPTHSSKTAAACLPMIFGMALRDKILHVLMNLLVVPLLIALLADFTSTICLVATE